jgi:acyl carrier protein
VEARVRSYETAIGDLEQRAPGADPERDPLLRRSPPLQPGAGENVAAQTPAPAPAPVPGPPGPASAVAGADSITDWILDWLARTLEVDPDGLDPERPFADLGIDSVFAVELAQELGDWVGRPLEATILWSYSTADSLARHLAADCGTSGTGAAAGRPMPAVGGLR